MTKFFLRMFGHIFVILGAIGIFLPILPTTPFLIAALWCYGKSSEKLRQKLLAHPQLGPSLKDWVEHRAIKQKTKVVAMLVLATSLVISLVVITSAVYKIFLVLLYVGIATFILTRPSQ
ncbi:MAG: YbaN family protein [bacterium]|nr:YbaN family protein [bacterium]